MTTASVLSARPWTPFTVEFPELYARHLCRHAQFGINAVHLAAVLGTWFALYGMANGALAWLGAPPWTLPALAAIYLLGIAFRAPFHVLAATALFVGLLLAAVFALPAAPLWANALMIPAWYKVQSWSHRVWNRETDMTEFNAKFRKGPLLFVTLTIYEAPILLNYLLFDRKNWAR